MSYKLINVETVYEEQLHVGNIPLIQLHTHRHHRRLKLFYHRGTTCVRCGRVGIKLLVNKFRDGSVHIDIFTADNHLMTVDHIIPKSKGGSKLNLSNMQVMCSRCNTKKGDKIQ